MDLLNAGIARLLCAVIISAICASEVFSANIYVSKTGSNTPPYNDPSTAARSIQVAVDYANSSGDTVWILPGTYLLTSQVKIESKSVTVRSRDGRAVTVIDGQNSTRCFFLLSSLAVLHDLTICNGLAPASDTSPSGESYGGGVVCDFGGSVSHCVVENCSADYGGGVRIRGFGEVRDQCIIRNNTAGIQGGGVQMANPQNENSILRVIDSEVYGNRASGSNAKGGGVYCFEGGSVEKSDIHDNHADYGGGVRLYQSGSIKPTVLRSRIYRNTADVEGGGIHVLDGGKVVNTLVYDNSANQGGGIYLYDGGDIHSTTICDNSAGGSGAYGGGLYVRSSGSIKNSIIYLNEAVSGGANYWNNTSGVDYQYCAVSPWISSGNNISGLNPEVDFVNRDARDYYLKDTSICIDVGGAVGAPSDDFAGITRPLDGTGDNLQKFDIGAYEYWGDDDIDQDGMPTYWELANGLDPNNPADGGHTNRPALAIEDPDGDDLVNYYEYNNYYNGQQHSTDPHNPDTDGDGITDFEEVHGMYPSVPLGFVTDAANPDTDGDGFNDKFEIDNDSNPTNALSYLTTLSGLVTYSGTVQTGKVVVSVSNAGITTRTTVISGVGGYAMTNVPTLVALEVKAYRDSNGNMIQDTWEASGVYSNNPVVLHGATGGIDIVLDDPATDSDYDGLSDFFEIYTSFTDPNDPDTDNDTMRDGWEWGYRPIVNPTNAADKTLDFEPDGLENWEEFAAGTDPGNPDTDGDLLPDGWEWDNRPATHPTNAFDAVLDPDLDGLSNSNEYAVGTDPNVPDTDGDGMPDGWEVQYMPALSPTNAADKTEDPDSDNLQNIDEFAAGTDPTEGDTDGDGMSDGWEVTYSNAVNPTNAADRDLDFDSDNLSNYDEFVWGTNPENPDTDGDGVSDGDEVAAGTDPLDSGSFPVSISGALDYSGTQTGLYYAVASQQPAGNVYRSVAITNAGAYAIENVAILKDYYVSAFLDSNGNASQDVWEAAGTFSDTNGVPVLLYLTNNYVGADISLGNPTNDTDGDGLTDYDEHYMYGTDPLLWDTDGDSMPDGWEAAYTNACDPLDPGDWSWDLDEGIGEGLNNSNEYVYGTNPELIDTDGDGLHDHYEISNANPTDPTDPDSDGDGLTDGEEVGVPVGSGTGTDPNNNDSDGDGFSDGDEVNIGSDPLDPASFPASISGDIVYGGTLGGPVYVFADDGVALWTNTLAAPGAYSITNLPTLTNYTVNAFMDSNTNGVKDTWEAQGVYTNNPIQVTNSVTGIDVVLVHPAVDTDGDGLTDYNEVNVYGTDPNNPDSDGDSMRDGWEVTYSNAVDPLVADGQTDYDSDNLTSSNEYVWVTNPEVADTDGDSMPDGWEVAYSNACNPTNAADGVEDWVGEFPSPDGLVNSNEFVWNTNPEIWDTDGDGSSDGAEVSAGTDPVDSNSYPVSISGSLSYTGAQTGPVYALLTEGTNVTADLVVLAGTAGSYAFADIDTLKSYTVTGFRDSNTNNVLDTWEASGVYSNNPILHPTNSVTGVDFAIIDPVSRDTDGDGLTDMDEVYKYRSAPDNPDTDGDLMPDGWEVAHSNAVDVLVADGTNDFDADGLINSNEYVAGTDPANVDSDGDSMWDGWEFAYPNAVNPTNPADGILDVDLPHPDGLVNSNEFIWGTNPEAWDTDGDSIPDGWETVYTNAVHPTNGLDGAQDYIGETNASGAVEMDGLVNSNEYKWGTSPELFDTDGDGAGDGLEVQSGTDPTNAASYPIDISAFLINHTAMATGDAYLVLNLSSNGNEFASFNAGFTDGSNLPVTASNVPNLTTYWSYAYIDINSNGVYETWEPYGVRASGNNSVTPTNDISLGLITIYDSVLDSDNDGLTDYDEVYTYFTNPTNSDTDADSFIDGEEVNADYPSDPNDPASFHITISGTVTYTGTVSGAAVVLVTDSIMTATGGVFSVGAYATPTNIPTLTNYYVMAYIDENSNSVMDTWEPRGTADTYPIYITGNVSGLDITISDPTGDSDGDGLTDYEENFIYFTNPYTNDTDGDLMLDGWEARYIPVVSPTNAADWDEDPDGDLLTNILEHANNTDPGNPDTDGDGVDDYQEVVVLGTDPLDTDTDGDGMPDGWEVTYMPVMDPLTDDSFDDPDNDGLSNLQEYEDSKTDPTNPDTDGEGLTDFEEYVTYGTIPTNTDTDADGFDDYDEVINIGSMATNVFDPWVVDDDGPFDPVPEDPDDSDPDANGTLEHPYDSLQRAIDAASDGYVVLVLDGLYTGNRNRDIDPKGKRIVIRSRNGADVTRIENGFGGGFICNTGEGTNTVIRGFKILTSVDLNGFAGVRCLGTSPTILECKFVDCGEAGVLCEDGAEPVIRDCIFSQNEGAVKITSSDPLIERCTMWLNEDVNGAGMWISGTSSPRIVNCVIAQNKASGDGGGVYVDADAVPVFINCTIADNVATNRGGGIFNAGLMHFGNGVLWGNTAADKDGFYLDGSGQLNAEYCCMQTFHPNTGNKVADPLFVGASDYDLQSTSPCIDEGSGTPLGDVAPEDDRDGEERIFINGAHSKYDMGAYEYHSGGRITIQSPGGIAGETLDAGLSAEIQWTWESGVSSNLVLEYTYDFLAQSPVWHTIATNVYRGDTNGVDLGAGSYTWIVPQTNTSRCYVRASDGANSQITGVSPVEFSIADGLRVLAPNGGGVYYIGQTTDVSWVSSATTNPAVDIVLRADSDISIASGVSHAGGGVTNSTNWVIAADDSALLTTNARMRVVYEDGSLSDESDGAFSILGLVVTQPSAGGAVSTGATVEVHWDAIGAGAAVDISLSTNSGLSFISLTNGVAGADGSNSYSWVVGNTPSSNALLRIQSVSDTNVVGDSGLFKISDGVTVTAEADVDGDGMSDEYEDSVGLDSQDGSGDGGADGDPDGDGFVNYSEMVAGTDPNDPDSLIGVLSAECAGTGAGYPVGSEPLVTIRWSAVVGRDYCIESSISLNGVWSDVSGVITADNEVMSWVSPSPMSVPRYYRIMVLE